MSQNLPPKRLSGEITNPALYVEVRRRWPGHPVSQEMLADAAKVSDQPFYIAATHENCRALYAEMTQEARARERDETTRRDLSNMRRNFGPVEPASEKGA